MNQTIVEIRNQYEALEKTLDLFDKSREALSAAWKKAAPKALSSWHIIRHIYLPLCHNSIGTAIICSITSRIAMYEAIALTTSGGPGSDTMSLSVLMMRAISDYNYGFANAIGVVMFLFGILVLLVVNKVCRMGKADY